MASLSHVLTIQTVNISKKKKRKLQRLCLVQNVMEQLLRKKQEKEKFSMVVVIIQNVTLHLGINQSKRNVQIVMELY